MSSAPSSQPADGPDTRVETLPNGLRVAATALPQSQGATLAAYVGVGSRHEARQTLGLSHYLEHMLFKGTERRPEPTAISAAIEGAGGSLNAFTTYEMTAYHNRVPYDRVPLAMDVLADSVRHSLLAESEMERERTVIGAEIRRAHDQPAGRAGQLIGDAVYGDQPLGWEIAGDLESVGAITRDHLQDHIDAWYRPENMVLSVAGRIDPDEIFELAQRHWSDAEPADTPERDRAHDGLADDPLRLERREIEQCNLRLALRALPRLDPDRYAMSMLNGVLGRGMSSRLFLEIREKRGLAYSVGSHAGSFADTGHFGISAGVNADDLLAALDVALEQLLRIRDEAVADEELERAREHAIGSFRLSLDTAGSWCHRAGGQLLANGFIEPADEIVAGLQAVDAADIQRVAARFIQPGNLALAVVGPFDDETALRERMTAFARA